MIWRIFLALSLIWPVVAYAADIPADQRISAYQTMSAETRAMQDDDAANPATLWVLDGEALWKAPAGQEQKSCADCHGDAHEKMKGVAARYPRFDETRGKPVDIEQQINICRTERQNATPLAWESHDLLALTAYVARQSRGEKISMRAHNHRLTVASACSRRDAVNSISPARNATTTIGARASRAPTFRRVRRRAIRCIVLSGNRWARCEGVCVTVCRACARNSGRKTLRNMSISNFI
jgi:hypothetical protein